MEIPNLNYNSVSIREILNKFKIVDTRINDSVLDIEIVNTELKHWKKDESQGEKIIVTGEYKEPMIKNSNNIVELELTIDPLEEWNHVIVIKTIPNNFVSGRIYDNEGMGHTIT